MSDRSVQLILHSDLNLHPYKLQTVHSLSDWDKEVGLQFYHHFQGILTKNPDVPNNLLMSDEANFPLHSTVNKQNFQYWSAANPHELHQHPLYDQKVTVECAVWSRGVTGQYFFEDADEQAITVTSKLYT